VGAIREFLSENLTMPKSLAEHLAGGDVSSVEELKAGQGGLIRKSTGHVAAYRDESGALHLRSATCTHAGCLLHWNPFERCWDCTCHGSQFSVDGDVLNGPAYLPLKEAEA
jgi:Rieske Fe-S protein